MARSSEARLKEAREEFDSEQGIAFEALYRANPEKIDFEVARDIGLLRQDTIDKIQRVFPDHEIVFARILEREMRSRPPMEAFKVSIEWLVGRALFDQRLDGIGEIEHKDGPLLTKLRGGRLKFEVGDNLDGRTELKSPARRLNAVDVAMNGAGPQIGEIREKNSDRRRLEADIEYRESSEARLLSIETELVERMNDGNFLYASAEILGMHKGITERTLEISRLLNSEEELGHNEVSSLRGSLTGFASDLRKLSGLNGMISRAEELADLHQAQIEQEAALELLQTETIPAMGRQHDELVEDRALIIGEAAKAVPGLTALRSCIDAPQHFVDNERLQVESLTRALENIDENSDFEDLARQTLALEESGILFRAPKLRPPALSSTDAANIRRGLRSLREGLLQAARLNTEIAQVEESVRQGLAEAQRLEQEHRLRAQQILPIYAEVLQGHLDIASMMSDWDLVNLERLYPGIQDLVVNFETAYKAAASNFNNVAVMMDFMENTFREFIYNLTEVLDKQAHVDLENGLEESPRNLRASTKKWKRETRDKLGLNMRRNSENYIDIIRSCGEHMTVMAERAESKLRRVEEHSRERSILTGQAANNYMELYEKIDEYAEYLRELEFDHLENLAPGIQASVQAFLDQYDSLGIDDIPGRSNQEALSNFLFHNNEALQDAVIQSLWEGQSLQRADAMRLAAEIQSIDADIAHLNEGSESKVLAAVVDGKAKQSAKYDEDIQGLEAKRTAAGGRKTGLEAKKATVESEKGAAENNIQRLVGEISGKESDISAKQSEIEALEADLETLNADLSGIVENVQAAEEAQDAVRDYAGMQADIDARLTAYERASATREQEISRLEEEILKLEQAEARYSDDHIVKALTRDGVSFPSLRGLKRRLSGSLSDDEAARIREELDQKTNEGEKIVWSRAILGIADGKKQGSLLATPDPSKRVARAMGSFAKKYTDGKYSDIEGMDDTALERAGHHMWLGAKARRTLDDALTESEEFEKLRATLAELDQKRADLEKVKAQKPSINGIQTAFSEVAAKIELAKTKIPEDPAKPDSVHLHGLIRSFEGVYAQVEAGLEHGTIGHNELRNFYQLIFVKRSQNGNMTFHEGLMHYCSSIKSNEEAAVQAKEAEVAAAETAIETAEQQRSDWESELEVLKTDKKNSEDLLKEKAEELESVDTQLAQVESEISGLNDDISEVEQKKVDLGKMKPSEWLINQAFGDFDAVALRRAKRAEGEAQSDKENLKKTEEYFATSALRNLVAEYGSYAADAGESDYASQPLSEQITSLTEEIRLLKDSLRRRGGNVNREQVTSDVKSKSKELERLKSLRLRSGTIVTAMRELATNLEVLIKLDVYEFPGLSLSDIRELKDELEVLDTSKPSFKCKDLLELGAKLKQYYSKIDSTRLTAAFDKAEPRLEEALAAAVKNVADLEAAKAANSGLTDSTAGKKLHMAIIEAQFGDELSLEQKGQLAAMIMTDDIAKMQVDKDYKELAEMATADLYDTMEDVSFKNKLIDFRYKKGDEVIQPFKGLKPRDFSTVEGVEKLFARGKINLNNGFFFLAAMEKFRYGANAKQADVAEAELKKLIAKELGVADRMDEAAMQRIVEDAYHEHLEVARPMIDDFFELDNDRRSQWTEYKVFELNKRYKLLKENRRLGEISGEKYEEELKKLLDEAGDYGVESDVDFSTNSFVTAWWQSPAAQKFRDFSASIGNLAVGKMGRVASAGGILAGKALWGATKTTAGLTFQTAIMPIRATKYPLLLVAKPFVGFVNLFRKQKWVPLPGIRASVKNDVSRIKNYFVEEGHKRFTGAAEAVTTVPGQEWAKTQYEFKAYSERTKINKDELKERAEEYAEKSKVEAIDSENSVVDLQAYRDRISQVDSFNNPNSGNAAQAAA